MWSYFKFDFTVFTEKQVCEYNVITLRSVVPNIAFVFNLCCSVLLQEKDIALAPITITADRELVIDFSKPFMDFSMSLIMQKPGEPPIDIFAFLLPFNAGVWLSTIGVVTFTFTWSWKVYLSIK